MAAAAGAETPKAAAKRQRGEEESPAAAKAPRLSKVAVGDWVVLRAASRKSVDRLKAKTPCLVTLVDGGRVQVLYPNQLSVFMHKQDGEVSVRFRTEKCDLAEIRQYKGESASLLDRKMILLLCSSIASAAAKAEGGPAPATPPAAALPEDCRSPVAARARGEAWLLDFTALVAEAFRAEGREVLDMAALRATLGAECSEAEVEEGLAALDRLNKVMIADNAVFLVA